MTGSWQHGRTGHTRPGPLSVEGDVACEAGLDGGLGLAFSLDFLLQAQGSTLRTHTYPAILIPETSRLWMEMLSWRPVLSRQAIWAGLRAPQR